MRRRDSTALRTAAATLCLAPLWAATAVAQEADEWKFQAVAYLFLPSVSGETVFPGPGGPGIDPSKILDNLNLVFMGSFGAEKGRWGMFTDVVYLDIGDSESPSKSFTIGGSLPVDATATVRYDLEGWSWTLAGSWNAASAPAYHLNVIGGARLLDIDQAIDWQLSGNVGSIPLADRSGVRTAGVSNWDAIIGVRGRAMLGEKRRWVFPFYFDIGTGQSSLTWQAMVGAGYAFGWGDLTAAWRHLDYDMKPGKAIESISFDGPGIAATFRW